MNTYDEKWPIINYEKFDPELLDAPLTIDDQMTIRVEGLFGEDISFEEIAAVWGVMAATPRHTYQVLTKRPERALEFLRWVEDRGYETGEGPMAGISVYTLFRDYHENLDAWSDDGCPAGGPDHETRAPWSASNPCPTHDITGADWPLPNVWLGVSCKNQVTSDEWPEGLRVRQWPEGVE